MIKWQVTSNGDLIITKTHKLSFTEKIKKLFNKNGPFIDEITYTYNKEGRLTGKTKSYIRFIEPLQRI